MNHLHSIQNKSSQNAYIFANCQHKTVKASLGKKIFTARGKDRSADMLHQIEIKKKRK